MEPELHCGNSYFRATTIKSLKNLVDLPSFWFYCYSILRFLITSLFTQQLVSWVLFSINANIREKFYDFSLAWQPTQDYWKLIRQGQWPSLVTKWISHVYSLIFFLLFLRKAIGLIGFYLTSNLFAYFFSMFFSKPFQ